jgi:hypothetical protein
MENRFTKVVAATAVNCDAGFGSKKKRAAGARLVEVQL